LFCSFFDKYKLFLIKFPKIIHTDIGTFDQYIHKRHRKFFRFADKIISTLHDKSKTVIKKLICNAKEVVACARDSTILKYYLFEHFSNIQGLF